MHAGHGGIDDASFDDVMRDGQVLRRGFLETLQFSIFLALLYGHSCETVLYARLLSLLQQRKFGLHTWSVQTGQKGASFTGQSHHRALSSY